MTTWAPAIQAQQKELADLQNEVMAITSMRQEMTDLKEYLALAAAEAKNDAGKILEEAEAELPSLEARIQGKEREVQFDGPHDQEAAIITIQAGAGGTDAQDWAQMLERMYLRFADRTGWPTRILNRSAGEEAGLKHTTFEAAGKFAYGILRGEAGVHRLVRQSPFNAKSLRQTSFARVEVLPKLSAAELAPLDERDLKIDTFRASGAGGQHVNKTSSAVRIRHLPTGIVVECQNERSQGQNKAQALALLQAKLQILREEQEAQKTRELRGEIREAAWGNQIRSYVLHPYQMVKDHRTNVETSNVQGILDGDLSIFLRMV